MTKGEFIEARWNAIGKLIDDCGVTDAEMPEFVQSFTLSLLVAMADDIQFSSVIKKAREHYELTASAK